MIRIYEHELVDIIKNKLEYVKSNPMILSKIFDRSDEELASCYKDIFKKDFYVGEVYPVDNSHIPCICVSISSEEESSSGIGDQYIDMDAHYDNVSEFSKVFDVDNGVVSFSKYGKVMNIDKVFIEETMEDITNFVEVIDDYTISVLDVISFGKVLISGTVKISNDIDIAIVCSTSYTIEIWTENAELTVNMYHLVKWFLLSERQHLIDIGIYKQKLKGGDLAPVTSFTPTLVYKRGITLSCETYVTLPELQSNLVSDITVEQILK